MVVERNLRQMEEAREAYWMRYPSSSPVKLRWRALTVRHCFHILPGETILELGAGSGLWTEHLAAVLHGENAITAATFNEAYARDPRWSAIANSSCVCVESLDDLPGESFDYIVGTAILCHDQYPQNLRALFRLLKPGGQILFFENNYWNPQVFVKNLMPPLRRWSGNAPCQVGLRKYHLLRWASEQGFTHLEVIPYDIIHPLLPRRAIAWIQSLALIFEHMPIVKEMSGTLYIRAQRPENGLPRHRMINLAEHEELRNAVSFVIPSHNEEMNIRPLVETLVAAYGPYIHEILIVNDNSRDRTAEVTLEVAREEPRVKLLNRNPPNGVGRALADGYAAATGRYIFTMDADFIHLVPEFRDLFDAVIQGYDGAIGSRFTQESIMINYPFIKILCNRGFHLLANLFLKCRVHDISNNLKLFRADILQNIRIEETDFAANAETGLKPILAGYRIREVPVSWINRTIDMGSSSFRIVKVAPNYFHALLRVISSGRRTNPTPIFAAKPAADK